MKDICPSNIEDLVAIIDKHEKEIIEGELLINIKPLEKEICLLPNSKIDFIIRYLGVSYSHDIQILERVLYCENLPSSYIQTIADKIIKNSYINNSNLSDSALRKVLFLIAGHRNSPPNALDFVASIKNTYYPRGEDSAANSTYYKIALRDDVTEFILDKIVLTVTADTYDDTNDPYNFCRDLLRAVGKNQNTSIKTIEKLSKLSYEYVASNPKLPDSNVDFDLMILSGKSVLAKLCENKNLSVEQYEQLAKKVEEWGAGNLLRNPRIPLSALEIIFSRRSDLHSYSSSIDIHEQILTCPVTPKNILASYCEVYKESERLRWLSRFIARHPNVDEKILEFLAKHKDLEVRQSVISSKIADARIKEIAQKKPSCYIATYLYGSQYADEVVLLRDFRDEILLRHNIGYFFTKLYYKSSPVLIKMFKDIKIVDFIIKRIFIAPLLALLKQSPWYKNTLR